MTHTRLLQRVGRTLERWQVPCYLAALAAGVAAGLLFERSAALATGINPALGLLLYATFLGVPLTGLRGAWADRRFLAALLLLNFVVVPLVAYGLSRFVAADDGLLFGVLLVLLTPCIDYVIVFCALAGAEHGKLLAATPLLMVLQLLLLPGYLYLMAGTEALDAIDAAPFIEALVLLILLPLGLAALTQWAAARVGWAARLMRLAAAGMVPLMMLVLFLVAASQISVVLQAGAGLLVLLPLYAGFLAIMLGLGVAAARAFRLEAATGRALVFSGATRNSLVVLPLALALPGALAIVPAVVVTQTLVELVGMVLFVRVVPRLLPGLAQRARAARRSSR